MQELSRGTLCQRKKPLATTIYVMAWQERTLMCNIPHSHLERLLLDVLFRGSQVILLTLRLKVGEPYLIETYDKPRNIGTEVEKL